MEFYIIYFNKNIHTTLPHTCERVPYMLFCLVLTIWKRFALPYGEGRVQGNATEEGKAHTGHVKIIR